MINKYFDEPIVENDLFYICFLFEKYLDIFINETHMWLTN